MVSPQDYDNFDLLISLGPNGYRAHVSSVAGQPFVDFVLPFDEAEIAALAELAAIVGRDEVRGLRPVAQQPSHLDLCSFGERLYLAVFVGDVETALQRSIDISTGRGRGLRIRLLLGDDVSELAALPWEYLYSPKQARYLAQSETSPVIRFLRLPLARAPGAQSVRRNGPTIVLAVVASPTDVQPLAVEEEWCRLNEALAPLVEREELVLERLRRPTLAALSDRLRDSGQGQVHVLHFIGHGYFDVGENQGGLVFELEDRTADFVSAEMVATTLYDHSYLRLVFLNACRGAQGGAGSMFGGVAQRLIRASVPIVLAMQRAVSDRAVVDLAGRFYRSLAEGRRVDGALSTARSAVRTDEWGTPVLFSRSDDNRLFDLPVEDPAEQALRDALALLEQLPVDEVPPVWHSLPAGSRMPYPANPLFVGRSEDLRALAGALRGGATVAVGQVAAATGTGGIGKTQLAVEFVHRYGRYFAGGVFWLNCAEAEGVPAEIVRCAGADGMGLPGFDGLELEEQVGRVLAAWREPVPRLLVFDNCEDEDLLGKWRPASGGCRVLITTRRAKWSRDLGVQAHHLGVLPRKESIDLLHGFRPDLPADHPCLDKIAGELGDLPLALHMAGKYMEKYLDDVAPGEYLAQLRHPDLLKHRSLSTDDRSSTGHDLHVARTFKLSLDRLNSGDPPTRWPYRCSLGWPASLRGSRCRGRS